MRYLALLLFSFSVSAQCPPEEIPETPAPIEAPSSHPVVWGPIILLCDKPASPESGWAAVCWSPDFGDLECHNTYAGLACMEAP